MKTKLEIGSEFTTDAGRWRVTDVGTRVVVAIKIDSRADQSWFEGPPYAVAEMVFDEHDLELINDQFGEPS